jgi:hypothetical protein
VVHCDSEVDENESVETVVDNQRSKKTAVPSSSSDLFEDQLK